MVDCAEPGTRGREHRSDRLTWGLGTKGHGGVGVEEQLFYIVPNIVHEVEDCVARCSGVIAVVLASVDASPYGAGRPGGDAQGHAVVEAADVGLKFPRH